MNLDPGPPASFDLTDVLGFERNGCCPETVAGREPETHTVDGQNPAPHGKPLFVGIYKGIIISCFFCCAGFRPSTEFPIPNNDVDPSLPTKTSCFIASLRRPRSWSSSGRKGIGGSGINTRPRQHGSLESPSDPQNMVGHYPK